MEQHGRDRLFKDDSYTSVTCALLARGEDDDDDGSYFWQILQQGDFPDPDPFPTHDYACKDLNTYTNMDRNVCKHSNSTYTMTHAVVLLLHLHGRQSASLNQNINK